MLHDNKNIKDDKYYNSEYNDIQEYVKVNQIWKYKHLYSLNINNGYIILIDISNKTLDHLDHKVVTYRRLEKNSKIISIFLNLFLQDFFYIQ